MTYLALVSHLDELRQIRYVIRMTYSSILCHPDDLTEVGLSLSGVPDYFGRNKISSGGDLSHYSSASLY